MRPTARSDDRCQAGAEQGQGRPIAPAPAIGGTGGANETEQGAGGAAEAAISLRNEKGHAQSDGGDDQGHSARGAPDPGIKRFETRQVEGRAEKEREQGNAEQENGHHFQEPGQACRGRPAARKKNSAEPP